MFHAGSILSKTAFVASLAATAAASANLPQGVMRGVNLGGLFIVEPWMMGGEWSNMGCGDYPDEWTCMQSTGGSAQSGFTNHWSNWITQDDINQIASWGLNTVRIPVGHWIVEDTINDNEPWARGGFTYLKRLLSWCNDAGIYAIIDLHGAPDVQTPNQAFTGHSTDSAGFYNQDSFGRAKLWAYNITMSKINDPDFANVFAIEVLNEPTTDSGVNTGLVDSYYPTVYQTIRDAENNNSVTCGSDTNFKRDTLNKMKKRAYNDCLNIVYMDARWGAGDPTSNLPSTDHVIFDDHRYFAYNPNADQTRDEVISDACDRSPVSGGTAPVFFGEFSLALSNENGDFDIGSDGGMDFYKAYIGSEIQSFETGAGWTFWTYKTETDFAWSYSAAVDQGVIPSDASQIASQATC